MEEQGHILKIMTEWDDIGAGTNFVQPATLEGSDTRSTHITGGFRQHNQGGTSRNSERQAIKEKQKKAEPEEDPRGGRDHSRKRHLRAHNKTQPYHPSDQLDFGPVHRPHRHGIVGNDNPVGGIDFLKRFK